VQSWSRDCAEFRRDCGEFRRDCAELVTWSQGVVRLLLMDRALFRALSRPASPLWPPLSRVLTFVRSIRALIDLMIGRIRVSSVTCQRILSQGVGGREDGMEEGGCEEEGERDVAWRLSALSCEVLCGAHGIGRQCLVSIVSSHVLLPQVCVANVLLMCC
jgi:hypothetical protein